MKTNKPIKPYLLMTLGAFIVSFGLVNIHQPAQITEGGVLGLILLLNHWLKVSPSVISPILDIICYAISFKMLGKQFIKRSIFATIVLSLSLSFWELFPRFLPHIGSQPILAAILGGMSIGLGIGLIIRSGGSGGGDDALALIISKSLNIRIAFAYLFTDLTVLLFSLSYIPLKNIVVSLLTVTVSSYLIDFCQRPLPFHPNVYLTQKKAR